MSKPNTYNTEKGEFVNTAYAALYLGVSETRLYGWREHGKNVGPVYHVQKRGKGTRVWYTIKDLDDWLNTVAANKPRLSHKAHPVTTPLGTFTSINAACKFHKIRHDTGKRRLETGAWSYILPEKYPRNSKNCSRKVMTPDGEFPSISEARRHFKISKQNADTQIKKGIWKLIDPPFNRNITHNRPVITPNGTFKSIRAAVEFHKIAPQTAKNWLKQGKWQYETAKEQNVHNPISGYEHAKITRNESIQRLLKYVSKEIVCEVFDISQERLRQILKAMKHTDDTPPNGPVSAR